MYGSITAYRFLASIFTILFILRRSRIIELSVEGWFHGPNPVDCALNFIPYLLHNFTTFCTSSVEEGKITALGVGENGVVGSPCM
ncbi:hypothetical protein ES703_104166 [subsurface metagenome]